MNTLHSDTSVTPTVESPFTFPPDHTDQALAARYTPLIQFDEREPFFPLAAGYTIFRTDAPSPSFPRQIQLAPPDKPPATLAIEYAIWWDWDIGHLYELEHVWVYVDHLGNIVRAEASWHGDWHDITLNGHVDHVDNHVRVYSEPGKHAFAPHPAWFEGRRDKTRHSCNGRGTGRGGLLVTPLFENLVAAKTPLADRLVHSYLLRQAFEPSYQFNRSFSFAPEMLVPWPALFQWIPQRVEWWLAELERHILPDQRRIIRIAHRGASAYAPENTLAAIDLAAEMGADMVELDIQLTADGVPVLLHDSDLSRTTNGSGRVSTWRLQDLKTLDAGQGQTIPTLEEAILLCRERDLGLYLELKDGKAAPALVQTLRQHGISRWTVVSSFRPDWLADVKALAPEIPVSVLFGSPHIDPVALAQAVGASFVHPAWERRASHPHRLLTETWIQQAREAKLGIICWHEERPDEIAALRRLGVDAICSDTPDVLLAHLSP